MMQRRDTIFFLLSVYGCVLIVGAVYFLLAHQPLVAGLRAAVPVLFLLRLSTFWYGSLVLAILVFAYLLKHHSYGTVKVERSFAKRLGQYVFGLGTLAAAALMAVLLVAYTY